MTAALQLFAHLDGEALNVALLMPAAQRERWKDLVDDLSEYYDSPGRLVVVWRRFESASRRSGVDPATIATELGIVAMRGFADMGERARDLMIRNKFIAAQQSCELRRYLDGAAADASIRDIVDSCCVWESHTEAGYDGHDGVNPKFLRMISQVASDAQPHLASEESEASQDNMRRLVPTPVESPPRVALSSTDRELLIQRVLETYVQAGQQYRCDLRKWRRLHQVFILVGKVVPSPTMPLGRDVCFSCGQQGHGVTRCSQMDVSFPFLLPGWSVDMRNGRYRASRIRGDGRNYTPAKVGSSETVVQLTRGGGGG